MGRSRLEREIWKLSIAKTTGLSEPREYLEINFANEGN